MDLLDLGKKVCVLGAPLLGNAIAGPGGAAIAQVLAKALCSDAEPEKISTALDNHSNASDFLANHEAQHIESKGE